MEKTATLNLRVSPEIKREAESVLDRLGIPMSTAITMYLRQIAFMGGIPFSLKLPDAPRDVDVARMGDAELLSLLEGRLAQVQAGSCVSLSEARAELLS